MVAASEAHYHPITVACCSDADAGARVLLLGHLAPFHHLALSLRNITRPLAAQNVADLQICRFPRPFIWKVLPQEDWVRLKSPLTNSRIVGK